MIILYILALTFYILNCINMAMKITYYGHSAFNITTGNGTRTIIDPYESGAFNGTLSYGRITDEADIVITSHNHADHNYTKDIKGKFVLINTTASNEINDVKIKTIAAFHDSSAGEKRGANLISVICTDNLTLAHMGDLGHNLDNRTIQEMGKIDVLLLPVGGVFTIDAATATKVMADIKPLITIPMHYKTARCAFPIADVENFTKGQKSVCMLNKAEFTITGKTLPDQPKIIVMQYAL